MVERLFYIMKTSSYPEEQVSGDWVITSNTAIGCLQGPKTWLMSALLSPGKSNKDLTISVIDNTILTTGLVSILDGYLIQQRG